MEKTELLSCKLRLEDHYQLGDNLYSCLVESKMDDTAAGAYGGRHVATGACHIMHVCLIEMESCWTNCCCWSWSELMLLELLQTGMLLLGACHVSSLAWSLN